MSGAPGDIRRLGELHIERARTLGLRLQAFCTGVFPIEWVPRLVEDVTLDLLDFAFHARRVNDVCQFNEVTFGPITHIANSISANDPGGWEVCYQHGLNALVHASTFTFGSGHLDHRQLFTASEGNVAPMYVQVRTDRFDQRTISLFGIAICFLTEVIPLVKTRYPDWRF